MCLDRLSRDLEQASKENLNESYKQILINEDDSYIILSRYSSIKRSQVSSSWAMTHP